MNKTHTSKFELRPFHDYIVSLSHRLYGDEPTFDEVKQVYYYIKYMVFVTHREQLMEVLTKELDKHDKESLRATISRFDSSRSFNL